MFNKNILRVTHLFCSDKTIGNFLLIFFFGQCSFDHYSCLYFLLLMLSVALCRVDLVSYIILH